MVRFTFHLRTDAPPEAVRAALLDFSERRPERWPGLPRDQYDVYEIGGDVGRDPGGLPRADLVARALRLVDARQGRVDGR